MWFLKAKIRLILRIINLKAQIKPEKKKKIRKRSDKKGKKDKKNKIIALL